MSNFVRNVNEQSSSLTKDEDNKDIIERAGNTDQLTGMAPASVMILSLPVTRIVRNSVAADVALLP